MIYVNIEQRSEEWHQWRRRGITATEAVAICGKSPYSTPWRVWAEKTGRVAPPDMSRNPYVQYGIDHEDEVRNIFMQQQEDVVMPACGEYEGNRIFRASFDGLNSNGEPVEIKCPSESTLEDVLARGEKSDAYQLYYWQVQWQIMVADAQRGWLVFFLGNDRIKVFEVARNDENINAMRITCEAFWNRAIVKDKAPEKIPDRDVFVPKGDDLIAWARAANDYRRIKAEIDRLTELLEEPKAKLVSLMGDFKNADFYGVSIAQYTQKGSIDYKKVLAKRGVLLNEEEMESCRRKSNQVLKVSLSTSDFPKDFIPEKNQDIAEAIRTIQSDRNNLCW
ncbi:YqaJ viral recombinase family nuclease [Sutterella sp.]|uniref:YqaJ viral recombinase family nuclease n=1 Tax=Sutterella sp. TaxID=1981025 RepID=UPI003FD80156